MNSNTDKNVVKVNKYSIGFGKLITVVENKIINILLKIYKILLKFFQSKYKNMITFFINNIINTKKLTIYSKYVILISIGLFLLRYISNLIVTPLINIDKCSFDNYLFFNSKVTKNNYKLLEKESQIKITKLEIDEKWEKVLKFLEKPNLNGKTFQSSNKKSLKNINLDDPFFKILKYYINMEKHININKINKNKNTKHL